MATSPVSLAIPTVPSGVIVSFAGTLATIPAGWHECDGSPLDRTAYASLFNAIGTHYGGSGNPDFNLPNLRGYFLRGASADASVDPDGPRTAGSAQGHALQNHTHSFPGAFLQAQGGGGFDGSGFAGNSGHNPGWEGPYTSGTMNAGNAAGETRPANVAVIYLIKL